MNVPIVLGQRNFMRSNSFKSSLRDTCTRYLTLTTLMSHLVDSFMPYITQYKTRRPQRRVIYNNSNDVVRVDENQIRSGYYEGKEDR